MRTITLTQPWATLVAIGAKQIETRSWSTAYRGPLAIHAGAGLGPVGGKRGLNDLCETSPFREVLRDNLELWTYVRAVLHREWQPVLPFGAVIATAELYDIQPTAVLVQSISEIEQAFGDYSAGRYGWLLRNVQMLPAPVPAKGALGLWEWSP